jgi:hypothetical protein
MQASSSPLIVLLLIVVAGIGMLSVVAWLLRAHLQARIVIAVGALQLVLYLIAFAVGFGLGDAGLRMPTLLASAVAVLGFPFMYLLKLPPAVFGSRWWGDDLNLVLGLAALNAIAWGVGVGFAARLWRKARAAA